MMDGPKMGEVWITELGWPLTLLHSEPDGTGKYAWTSLGSHTPTPRFQLRGVQRMVLCDADEYLKSQADFLAFLDGTR